MVNRSNRGGECPIFCWDFQAARPSCAFLRLISAGALSENDFDTNDFANLRS